MSRQNNIYVYERKRDSMRENMIYDTNQYQLRIDVIERMNEIIKAQCKTKTLFFGDSITYFMDVNKYFGEYSTNCGIQGITSDMLKHFVDEGVIKYEPQEIFIMIGTNDLGNTTMTSPRNIALNVKEIVEIIHENLPYSVIYCISCIPCLEQIHGYKSKKSGLRSNDTLKMIFEEYQRMIRYDYVHFLDVFDSMLDKNGQPIDLYYIDGLHLTELGYENYANAIRTKLKEENM